MASAILAGRSGMHHNWGENRAPLKTPVSPAPSPNPGRDALPRADTSKAPLPPRPPSPEDGCLTFCPAGLSHREAAALRERLNGELGQIVRKRNASNPELLEEEIDLDINEMDIETQWELDRFVTNVNKALNKSRRAAVMNGDIAEVGDTAGAEAVNGAAVATLVDNADVVESGNPEKTAVLAEQVDEYVDIEDEMPTGTYKSVEIEKGAEVMSVSGGSGSGSSSSSGSESGSSGDSASEAGKAHSVV